MTQTLSITGAILTLDERVQPGLALRSGGVNPDPIQPMRVGSPHNQGYSVWAKQPVGWNSNRPASYDYFWPAFTDMGGKTADVAPNSDMCHLLGVNPITIYPAKTPKSTGVISMRPLKMTAEQKKLVPSAWPNREYLSPAIMSYPYAQACGVFEVVAKLPKDRALWPAFWLLPADLGWPPEIDIFEMLGHDPLTLYHTVHGKDMKGGKTGLMHKPGVDLSAGYHSYAADWGPEQIRFYLDRKLVNTIPTPKSLQGRACFWVLDVSVGAKGTWPGPVDPKDPWLSEMLVTNIRAWQRPEYVA